MPAIVGVVQVISIGSGSVFHIGDVFRISAASNAKTFAGAGSFNTGNERSITKLPKYNKYI